MGTVRTILETREFIKVEGHADFVKVCPFDELEEHAANVSYAKAVTKANGMIGEVETLRTADQNEVTGRVVRVVVELVSYKTVDGRRWDHKVVGDSDDDPSKAKRTVLEAAAERGEPTQAPEKDESPALTGLPQN